jgi:uncharacterized membrane protein YkvA (DUF1232 family)
VIAHTPAEPPADAPRQPDPATAGSADVSGSADDLPDGGEDVTSGDPDTSEAAAWRPTRWSHEAVALLPDLARLLRALVGDPRVPRRAKIVAAAAGAYVASPIDLLPDVIPTVGGVDDLLVVLSAVRFLVATAGYDLVRELWTGNEAGFSLVIVLAGVRR